MSSGDVFRSYARALLWAALLMAVIFGLANIVGLVFIDFIHGNPHRTKENVILMMVLFTPLLGAIAFVGTIIVFALPQCLEAQLKGMFVKRFGRRAYGAVLTGLPLTAALTWYCYDYLTPHGLQCWHQCGPGLGTIPARADDASFSRGSCFPGTADIVQFLLL
jgi:hypothetical protein